LGNVDDNLHRLLMRQLRKLGLDQHCAPDDEAWAALLATVDRTYRDNEQDRYTLERSLAISSDEMQTLYQRQKLSYEARLRTILESLNDLLWLKDPNGVYLACNSMFERFVGVSEPSLVGRTDHEVLDCERIEFLALTLEVSPDEGTAVSREAWTKFADDGRLALIEYVMTPIPDATGKVVSVLGIGRDITKRRQAELARASLESQLRESQKMEAIGTLAGGIAHDFNNILATILGNVQMLREDLSDNPLALESVLEIRKAGSRARDLVQQILSFSRRQPTARRPITLWPVVTDSVRLLRATLPARLALDARCETDPMVLADATQIEQVVINLATNAMQAISTKEGHISIRLDSVTLDHDLRVSNPLLNALHERCDGRVARLVIADDGPGMDATTILRIFEPFFTTKPVDQGTGLGLSVVHGIVQAHDGVITVDSVPGGGARFSIFLPLVEASPPTPEFECTSVEVSEDLEEKTLRILYIDDDESLVFLVTRLLKRRGYDITGFTDQPAALATLRANPDDFGLIVSDYNMPGMSGLDVAREARAIRSDLPVAIASGFIDETLVAEARGAGVRELIFKANVVEELCEAFIRLANSVVDGKQA
jgi:PAS domain S-box-containing protein